MSDMPDDDRPADYYCQDEFDDEDENECEAFGGIGCRHMRCPEWGGDGLCFVEMRAGYGGTV